MRLITVEGIHAYIRNMGGRKQFSFYRDPEGFMNSSLVERISEVTPHSVFYKIAYYLVNQHFADIDQTEIDWIMGNPTSTYMSILLLAQHKHWGLFTGPDNQGAHNIWLEMIDSFKHSPAQLSNPLPLSEQFRKDLTIAAESLPYPRIFPVSLTLRTNMINELVLGGTPTVPLQLLIYGINSKPNKEVTDWYINDPAGLRLLIALFANSNVWGRSEPANDQSRSYHITEVAKLILAGDYTSSIPEREAVEKEKEKINFITYLHDVTCSTKRNKYIVTTKWAEIMQRYLTSANVNLAEWTGFATWVIKPSEEPNKEAYSFIEKFGDVHGAIRMALITCSSHEGHGIPPVGPCRSGYYQVDQKEIEGLVQQWDMWQAEDVTDQRREDDIEAILRIAAGCTDERDLKVLVGEAVCQFDQVHGENALQDNLCGPIIANDSRMPVWMYLTGYMHAKREQVRNANELFEEVVETVTSGNFDPEEVLVVIDTGQNHEGEVKAIYNVILQHYKVTALCYAAEESLERIARRIAMFNIPRHVLLKVIDGFITDRHEYDQLQYVIQHPELCALLAGAFTSLPTGKPLENGKDVDVAIETAIDTFYNKLTYDFNIVFNEDPLKPGVKVFQPGYLVTMGSIKWFVNQQGS